MLPIPELRALLRQLGEDDTRRRVVIGEGFAVTVLDRDGRVLAAATGSRPAGS